MTEYRTVHVELLPVVWSDFKHPAHMWTRLCLPRLASRCTYSGQWFIVYSELWWKWWHKVQVFTSWSSGSWRRVVLY